MLVLTRKVGEEIVLPSHGVTIGVVSVRGKQVRLGVAAPSATSVHRGEVWHRMRTSGAPGPDMQEVRCDAVRILIADTDHALSGSYREAFRASGIDVHTVTTGVECVARLRKCPPHVLVLDPTILWGGADGVLAVMRGESALAAVPVLVHGSPDDEGGAADLAFPVWARAPRPLPPEQMATLVRQLADGSGRLPEGITASGGNAADVQPVGGDVRTASRGDSASGWSPFAVDHPGRDAWQDELGKKIAARTHGYVLGLQIEVMGERLIVHGRSHSHYGRQLACAAALELMQASNHPPLTQVELNIEVLRRR